MAKLAALGNDRSSLIDCSSVIPNPAADDTEPTLPGGKVAGDIEGSVSPSSVLKQASADWATCTVCCHSFPGFAHRPWPHPYRLGRLNSI